MVTFGYKTKETISSGIVGRSNLPFESASMWVARETDPTPVVTRSNEVSRAKPTSSIMLRSHTRGGRSSAAILDLEMRPEIEFHKEPETDNPAEIQVFMSAICEGGLGTNRPDIPEIASAYTAADRPETSAAFPASQEIVTGSNRKLTNNTQTSTSHIRLVWSIIDSSRVDLFSECRLSCWDGEVWW